MTGLIPESPPVARKRLTARHKLSRRGFDAAIFRRGGGSFWRKCTLHPIHFLRRLLVGTAAASFGFGLPYFPSRPGRWKMGVTMATDLTVKERAFAELIVQGSKSAAYRTVYSARGSQATQATNAYKLSRKPKIKTEVARLLQQRAFPADDYRRLQETAIAGFMELFLRDPV